MGNTAICRGWCCSKSSQPKSDDESPAHYYLDDENQDGNTHNNNLTPLPPVKYGPCLEYDLRFPPFVTDANHRCPLEIDDILGTYDVLISAPGGFRYRKYLTTSDDDEESLLVTRCEDGSGRIKFELICKSNKVENRHDYQGWTCFSDNSGIIEYFDEEPAIIRIENSKDPFPDNFMGQRYGAVRFVDRRSATFYAGKEPCREKSRCPPMVGMKQAVKKLSDFATARNDSNHWIHRWLGLPVEIAAEVKQFLLATPLPPPVFFFEKDDLVLDTYAYDDSWADVVYVARKRP